MAFSSHFDSGIGLLVGEHCMEMVPATVFGLLPLHPTLFHSASVLQIHVCLSPAVPPENTDTTSFMQMLVILRNPSTASPLSTVSPVHLIFSTWGWSGTGSANTAIGATSAAVIRKRRKVRMTLLYRTIRGRQRDFRSEEHTSE